MMVKCGRTIYWNTIYSESDERVNRPQINNNAGFMEDSKYLLRAIHRLYQQCAWHSIELICYHRKSIQIDSADPMTWKSRSFFEPIIGFLCELQKTAYKKKMIVIYHKCAHRDNQCQRQKKILMRFFMGKYVSWAIIIFANMYLIYWRRNPHIST